MEWVLAAVCVLVAPSVLGIVALLRADAMGRDLQAQFERLTREVASLRRALADRLAEPDSTAQRRSSGPVSPPVVASTSPVIEQASPIPAPAAFAPTTASLASAPPHPSLYSETTGATLLPPRPAPSPRAVDAPASAERVEQNLGGRLFVWIGAVALFLAGVFFVKYTFDQGLITPALRVSLGSAFGIALIVIAERLRMHVANVAVGLTAAGVAIIYACLLAATNLYSLIPPVVGFALLALNTGLAISLSLRFGPFVAGLGLVGGFATPALIGSKEPNAGGLFGYLFLLQMGLMLVGRRRAWWPLSFLTLLGGFVWVVLWLLRGAPGDDAIWLAGFLLGSITLFVLAYDAADPDAAPLATQAVRSLGLIGASLGAGLLGVVAAYSGYSPRDWAYVGLLCMGSIVLARLRAAYAIFPFITLGLSLALLLVWQQSPAEPTAQLVRRTALAMGALFSISGFACLWGTPRAALFGWLAAIAGVAFWSAAYGLTRVQPVGLDWSWQCVILAAAYGIAAAALYLRRGDDIELNRALGALCVATTFFLATWAPITLRPEWTFAGWALQAAAIIAIADGLRLAELQPLAVGVAALATLRALTPNLHEWPLGDHPVFNWILVAYAISTGAMALAARCAARQRARPHTEAFEGAACLIAFVGLCLLVRHAFHPGEMLGASPVIPELATGVCVWLAAACALLLIARAGQRAVLEIAAQVFCAVATLVIIGGLVAAADFDWWRPSLSMTLVLNQLLFWLGAPLLLYVAVGFLLSDRANQVSRNACFGVAAFLLLSLATAEVRHAFQIESTGRSTIPAREVATYVLAWLGLSAASVLWKFKRGAGVATGFGAAVLGLATIVGVTGLVLIANPLFMRQPVGSLFALNWLIYIFLAPAAGFALTTRLRAAWMVDPAQRILGGVALLFVFVFITCEVRQAYRGEFLVGDWPRGEELYAYSVAWGLLSLGLLAAGISTHGVVLRWASLAVMVVAVGKVFLVDTARLQDLYRVLSLLGLGLSLMAIGFLYQRWVFRPAPVSVGGTT